MVEERLRSNLATGGTQVTTGAWAFDRVTEWAPNMPKPWPLPVRTGGAPIARIRNSIYKPPCFIYLDDHGLPFESASGGWESQSACMLLKLAARTTVYFAVLSGWPYRSSPAHGPLMLSTPPPVEAPEAAELRGRIFTDLDRLAFALEMGAARMLEEGREEEARRTQEQRLGVRLAQRLVAGVWADEVNGRLRDWAAAYDARLAPVTQ